MSPKIHLSQTIPQSMSGMRFDAALAKLFPDYSRAQLTKWIKDDLVTLDGATKKPNEKVKGFERVEVNATLSQPEQLSAQDIPIEVIYEDNQLIIINKPANLVVHPAAGNPDSTLANALVNHCQSMQYLPRAGLIHRLDKDTTGLIIAAKTIESYHHLVKLMQERAIKRHYYALVHGEIAKQDTIKTHMGRHPKNRLKMAVCQTGKEAITHFKVKQHFGEFTFLDIELETGRTHQIRVHMNYINHPIVGDMLYGKKRKFSQSLDTNLKNALDSFQRQALHAYRLTLPHQGKILTFEAPIPEDFLQLLQLIEKNHYE